MNTVFKAAAVAVIAVGSLTAPAAHASGGVGAIAHSRNGNAYGQTRNAPSKAEAERQALSACANSDCKVLVTFNDCGAVAESTDGNGVDYAGGYGATPAAAAADALGQLRAHGKPGRIGASLCN